MTIFLKTVQKHENFKYKQYPILPILTLLLLPQSHYLCAKYIREDSKLKKRRKGRRLQIYKSTSFTPGPCIPYRGRTKAEHLSEVSYTNLGVKYSPRAEIQSRQRVNLKVFVELAIGRSGVGSFLVENPTCRDFTTAQLNEINHLHTRYEPQTAYSLTDVRITTTDTFMIFFLFLWKIILSQTCLAALSTIISQPSEAISYLQKPNRQQRSKRMSDSTQIPVTVKVRSKQRP